MGKRKILIVDDELSIRVFVKRALEKDFTILEANDGKEAVDIALTSLPDLILMDIMMPGSDGLSACHTIKQNQKTQNIPVVMLTGVGYDLNRKLSMEVMGADGYITKPFSLEQLRETVDKLLPD